MKGKFFEYRKFLTGKIEYGIENSTNINGFICLTKDPKGEKIKEENILLRGSYIINSEWVVGIVLFAGKDTY